MYDYRNKKSSSRNDMQFNHEGLAQVPR